MDFETFKKFNETIPCKITIKGKGIVEQMRFNSQIMQTNKAIELSSESSIITNEALRITNNSIRELNTKTNIYYLQLERATWVIAGATLLSFISSLMLYFKNDDAILLNIQQTMQRNLIIQAQTLQSQKAIDDSLRSMAKDSVKKILILKK